MKSILIIGVGRFGKHLASKMQDLGNDVMIVDKNPTIIESASSEFTDSLIGDCTNENVVRSLGVNNFDICFVTIGENFEASLVITSILKSLGAKFVVAKAKRDIQSDILKKLGADEIIYPEREYAENLAMKYNAKNIFDYIQLTHDYSISEIPIMQAWLGKTVGSVNVRNTYKVNIIAIKNHNQFKLLPGADYIFANDDHIVVVGTNEDVYRLSNKT
ncbi:MAG: TrkA family potassium uptake protein [Clostridiales bacterium]|nr:TrkA family potassium uptake protein [Clostridiales bacterium]